MDKKQEQFEGKLLKPHDMAKVLRSKNAGPFRTTSDLYFDSDEPYHRVRNSEVLTKE